jgi:hypothetical protein
LDDLLLGVEGSAVEPPPNGDDVSEIEAMHEKNCGARLHAKRGSCVAQKGVIGHDQNSF